MNFKRMRRSCQKRWTCSRWKPGGKSSKRWRVMPTGLQEIAKENTRIQKRTGKISSSHNRGIFKNLETSDGSVNSSEERALKTKHAKLWFRLSGALLNCDWLSSRVENGSSFIFCLWGFPTNYNSKARLKLEIKDDTRTQAEVVGGVLKSRDGWRTSLSQKKDLIQLVLTFGTIFGELNSFSTFQYEGESEVGGCSFPPFKGLE